MVEPAKNDAASLVVEKELDNEKTTHRKQMVGPELQVVPKVRSRTLPLWMWPAT